MKSFTQFFLMFALIFSTQAFGKNQDTYFAKLKSYKDKDLIVSAKNSEDAVAAKTQEVLQTVQETVDLLMSSNAELSPKMAKELARVSAMSFRSDPSEAAAEMLLPLYKKHPKVLDKAINGLSKKAAHDLKDALANALREESEGNG